MCIKALDSESWPSVEGEILESKLERSKSDGATKYRANVNYIYEIAEKEFTGKKIGFSALATKSYTQKLIERYPVGENVEVYYNPENHSDSVLLPGLNFVLILGPTIGIIIISLSAILMIFKDKMICLSEKILEKVKHN